MIGLLFSAKEINDCQSRGVCVIFGGIHSHVCIISQDQNNGLPIALTKPGVTYTLSIMVKHWKNWYKGLYAVAPYYVSSYQPSNNNEPALNV